MCIGDDAADERMFSAVLAVTGEYAVQLFSTFNNCLYSQNDELSPRRGSAVDVDAAVAAAAASALGAPQEEVSTSESLAQSPMSRRISFGRGGSFGSDVRTSIKHNTHQLMQKNQDEPIAQHVYTITVGKKRSLASYYVNGCADVKIVHYFADSFSNSLGRSTSGCSL